MLRTLSAPCRSKGRAAPARPVVAQALSTGRPLDRELRAYFEPRFAFDFGDVRIHDDAEANRLAAGAGANALTVGRDIVFARGASGMESTDGRTRLAHELAHVVQSAKHPAAGAAAESVSDVDDPAEREAATIASQIAAGGEATVRAAPRAAIHRQPATTPEDEKKKWLKQHEDAQLHVHELITDTLAVGAAALAKPPQVGALPPLPTAKAPKPPYQPFSMVQPAPDPNQQFYNTAEWINDKTAAGALSFVILSPTHHSDKDGLRPYFDATVKYPRVGGDYPVTPIDPKTTHPRIVWESPSTAGERSSARGEIRLFMKGSTNDDEIRRNLIHEVQHVADRHDEEAGRALVESSNLRPAGEAQPERDARLSKAIGSASLWARYKSEFRAYWMQSATESDRGYAPLPKTTLNMGQSGGDGVHFGDPHSARPTSIEVKLPNEDKGACTPDKRTATFAHERQKAIFQYLISNDASYKFAKPYVCDADFSAKVDGYSQPEGLNLINSVRVDQLTTTINACDKTMKLTDAAVATMLAAAAALDTVDRDFLRHPDQAKPFWDNAAARLASDVLTALRARAQ